MYYLVRVLGSLMQLISLAMLAYCAMSWFVSPYNRFYQALSQLLAPLLNPFRRLQRRLTGIPMDFSPILALFALQLVYGILVRALL